MRITKGDKITDIPACVLVLGIIVANVCSMVSFNKRCDTVSKVSEEEE